MSRIITLEKINEIRFYQMPKAFFHNPLYTGMKNESKIAYSILRDLLSLSLENGWVNDKNEVYVKLSREKMMRRLNIKGSAKYAEIMKELIEKGLIVKRRVGLKKIDETYICLPEELSIIYSDKELLELENTDDSLKFENQTSRSSKIKPQEVRKSNLKKFENQTHINTNTINTNNITSSSSMEKNKTINLIKESKKLLSQNLQVANLQIENEGQLILSNTNIKNTKTKISSSSNNKFELENKPSMENPLVDKIDLVKEFEENICELKKTTKPKFCKLVSGNNPDMVLAVIEECANTNVKSYKGFEVAFNSYIERNCKTKEDVVQAAAEYRVKKKAKKSYNKKSNSKNNDQAPLRFNNFEPREYDYDDLEKKLLGWD